MQIKSIAQCVRKNRIILLRKLLRETRERCVFLVAFGNPGVSSLVLFNIG